MVLRRSTVVPNKLEPAEHLSDCEETQYLGQDYTSCNHLSP
jgi:hypothetical protein